MNFLRKHWYDLGGLIALLVLTYLCFSNNLSDYDFIMWFSLASLFFHQLEEYRIVGTFPGMVNKVMYGSDIPNRYPLNPNSAVYVNVFFGWTVYFIAAILGSKTIWFGMATILVSLGNTIAHTTLFNIKGKTIFNAGMATSWLLFAPIIYMFFKIIHQQHLVTQMDYIIGVPLGIVFNVIGIMKIINWCANKNIKYRFDDSQLLPKDRSKISKYKRL